MTPIRVTIWNEFVHELTEEKVKEIYPHGIHAHLAQALAADDMIFRTATLRQDEEHGLSQALLNETDVLVWWGHIKHSEVSDEVVARVAARVHEGMGFIPLHSAHASKPFQALMGMPCSLRWRERNERAHIWTVTPSHPIAQGIPLQFTLDHEEMYGEVFQVPKPDDIVFITWYQGGNVFRGGITYTRGMGKVFYFHPGHESLPSFHNENVLRVIQNAIRWAKPVAPRNLYGNCMEEPIETL